VIAGLARCRIGGDPDRTCSSRAAAARQIGVDREPRGAGEVIRATARDRDRDVANSGPAMISIAAGGSRGAASTTTADEVCEACRSHGGRA
jgi:hypothetical protein